MKFLIKFLCVCLIVTIAGCGGSSGNSIVTDGIDQQAKTDYEAQMKAQEEAETAAMRASGN